MSAHVEEAFRFAGADRDARIEAAYGRIPAADFSRHVLTGASNLDVYTWPARAGWTDLGTPDRLAVWLERRAPRPSVSPIPRVLPLVASAPT